jgi:hypothetical protein
MYAMHSATEGEKKPEMNIQNEIKSPKTLPLPIAIRIKRELEWD